MLKFIGNYCYFVVSIQLKKEAKQVEQRKLVYWMKCQQRVKQTNGTPAALERGQAQTYLKKSYKKDNTIDGKRMQTLQKERSTERNEEEKRNKRTREKREINRKNKNKNRKDITLKEQQKNNKIKTQKIRKQSHFTRKKPNNNNK